jgi:hypothetical protein
MLERCSEVNNRTIIECLSKHTEDLKTRIDEGDNVEYFQGAYDEAMLTIEALENIIIWEAEATLKLRELMERINAIARRKVND